MNKVLGIGLIVVVVAALAGGLAVVGGPEHARAEQRDETRRNDLRRFADYMLCKESGEAAFARACRWAAPVGQDPLTGEAYEVIGRADAFEVCATFELAGQVQTETDRGRHPLHFEGARGCLRYERAPGSSHWVVQKR